MTVSLIGLLYAVFIMPLQLFFEVVFSFAQRFTNNPGLSIIVLSLTVNFLVLPLYKRADALQSEQRDIEIAMKPGTDHIKQVFSGDEKMLILQTYYRQNNYKPTDVFKESLSLLLQIPFFIAAYRFLSDLAILNGASLGPIIDLGLPDALLKVGGININFLPLLMTSVNIISSIIYTKGFPLKSKIQLYAMALIFLVLLYPSPAGLVFYWTLNNLFSMIKNIFFKLRNPYRVLSLLSSVIGIVLMVFSVFFFRNTVKRRAIVFLIGIILFLLSLLLYFHNTKTLKKVKVPGISASDKNLLLLSGIYMSFLTGALISSAVIRSSPQEFIDVIVYQNPLWYVLNAFCIAFGTFVIWFGVFYWIADNTGKVIIEKLMFIACGVSVVDYLFFGTDLGVLSPVLQFNVAFEHSKKDMLINVMIIVLVVLACIIISLKYRKIMRGVLGTAIITMMIMVILNAGFIQREVLKAAGRIEAGRDNVHFDFSREGRNVVVLMLDRAMGPYIPYIINEKPEIKEKFDGFTYFSNTVSFGGYTNFGAPALFGGYEYTPVELNKRTDELLMDKHNEALKVMPVIFDDNGFDVTVSDPPYANYAWLSDLSIYDEYPEIKTYTTEGMYNIELHKKNIINNRRNFFMYGIMKISPLFLQKYIYNGGSYNRLTNKDETSGIQVTDGRSKAYGISSVFMDAFEVLDNLDLITEIKDMGSDTFLMLLNNSTHEPCLLQEPSYAPDKNVDNEMFDSENTNRFSIDGRKMKMESGLHYSYYETNMASLLKLGEWFDYLRENGVYDNTRIVIVSDHGTQLNQFDEFMLDCEGIKDDAERYNCLLMVKDFDEHGFSVSDDFMTNGDVPSIAMSGLIKDPVNPFTGKSVDNREKTAHEQYITNSMEYDVLKNNGTQFLPSDWLAVHDNIWDKDNWRLVAKNTVYTGE